MNEKNLIKEIVRQTVQQTVRQTKVALQPAFDKMDQRFVKLETRFDGLEGRFDGFEGRFDGLEGRFDGLEGRFDGLEGRFDGLEGKVNKISEVQDRVVIQVTQNSENIKEMKQDITMLKSDVRGIYSVLDPLAKRIKDNEQEQQMQISWLQRHDAEIDNLKNHVGIS